MPPIYRKFVPSMKAFKWDHVETKSYKPEGDHFKDITRQVLFEEGLPAQLRYFEIAPGGYSSFEKHEHAHAVMVLSGRGKTLVGTDVFDLAPFDLIHVPPLTWHQFYAAPDASLGFLCMVDCERDRPVRPDRNEWVSLKNDPALGPIIRP